MSVRLLAARTLCGALWAAPSFRSAESLRLFQFSCMLLLLLSRRPRRDSTRAPSQAGGYGTPAVLCLEPSRGVENVVTHTCNGISRSANEFFLFEVGEHCLTWPRRLSRLIQQNASKINLTCSKYVNKPIKHDTQPSHALMHREAGAPPPYASAPSADTRR
jgi:hypothetical protein